MAEVVNLRRARKAKKRLENSRTGETNRLAFGRSKRERIESSAARELESRRLDGHLRDRTE